MTTIAPQAAQSKCSSGLSRCVQNRAHRHKISPNAELASAAHDQEHARRQQRHPDHPPGVSPRCASPRKPSWSSTTDIVSCPAIVAAVTPPAPSVRTEISTVVT